MLMNIGSDYSALVSSIQKEWKTTKTTNLPETILQITRHFEFVKSSAKDNVLRVTAPTGTQQTPTLAAGALKESCINPECVEKGLTTHYTDNCWVKHPELTKKFALGRMRTAVRKEASKRLNQKNSQRTKPQSLTVGNQGFFQYAAPENTAVSSTVPRMYTSAIPFFWWRNTTTSSQV